jgi:tetratricopeptide (TPR) repeat protein
MRFGLLVLCAVLGACSKTGDAPKPFVPNDSANISNGANELPPLAELKKEYDDAKASWQANRSDKLIAAKFAKAAGEYAYGMMISDGPPKVKYPEALALANEALEVDPNNDFAKTTKMNIEAVYKSMGKSPPKSGR